MTSIRLQPTDYIVGEPDAWPTDMQLKGNPIHLTVCT